MSIVLKIKIYISQLMISLFVEQKYYMQIIYIII